MKTKTVTIHNWDGSKYDVEAPEEAKYLGILSNLGTIRFYKKKPRVAERTLHGRGVYYAPSQDKISDIDGACPPQNLPSVDGHRGERLFKIEEV